jgi:hypothetical protein
LRQDAIPLEANNVLAPWQEAQALAATACFAFASFGPSYKGPGQGQVHLFQAEVLRWATSRLDNLQEVCAGL